MNRCIGLYRADQTNNPIEQTKQKQNNTLSGIVAAVKDPPTFQDNYDLQVLGSQRLGGKLVQGARSVDGVTDDEGRDEEDAVAPEWVFHLDVKLAHWNHFPFCSHCPAYHLREVA